MKDTHTHCLPGALAHPEPWGPRPATVPASSRAGPPPHLPLPAADAAPTSGGPAASPPHFVSLPLQTSTSAPKSPTCAFLAPVPTAPEALIASAHLTLSCLTTGTVALVSLEPGSTRDEGRGGRWGGGRATSPRKGTCSFLCGSPGALSGVKLSLLSRVRATHPVFVILGASGEPNPSVCL